MTVVEITPRNASFAKACPQQVQLDVLRPCEPRPESPFLQKLFRAGADHEDDTFEALFEGVDGATVVKADDPDAREFHTLQAFRSGALIVAGGRFPVDHKAHRAGEPDLLVRLGGGYVPVEVKSHKTLDAVKKAGTGTALVSDVEAPFFEAAEVDTGHDAKGRVDDLLQLAHYRRLLEEAGYASPERNVGGVAGTDAGIVWHDLDEARLEPGEYLVDPPAGPLSAMALYDLEFAHRMAVHVAALEHAGAGAAGAPGDALLAEPVACARCDLCRWHDWCHDRLEDAADLSLIAGVGAARRRRYKTQGIDDLHDLASLDWHTAELARRKVDLEKLIATVRGVAPSTALADVIPASKKQLDDLASLGFETVADLARIDATTRDLCASGLSNMAPQIELARARVGTAPAYRKRGVGELAVPRGDIEIDVDMESTNDGCYLWGALVTDRRLGEPAAHYVPFATWDPDIDAGELIAFKDFWAWFSDERARAAAERATLRAYCYSKSAEQAQLHRLADRLGLRDDVDAFLDSEEWVDLLEVLRTQLITGRSNGLKEAAPLAGFAWHSDDGGGTLAMVKYDEAVGDEDPGTQAEARRWILEYNEDDVRATAALRAWLDGPARHLPSIDTAPG